MHDQKSPEKRTPTPTQAAPPGFLGVQADGLTLAIRVQPRASTNEVGGATGPELRLKVTAPPVDAAANEAVIRLLSEKLDCPRGKIQILRGHTSRHKLIKLHGMSAAEALARLGGVK